MRQSKGFSLIELLIVVAIILIIAAIAVPVLMISRIAGNQAAAAAAIRTLNTAQTSYATLYGIYAANLATLGGPPPCTPAIGTACLVDQTLGCAAMPCQKGRYTYTMTSPGAGSDFLSNGVPLSGGSDGNNSYCSTPDLVVRFQTPAAPALAALAACQALAPIPN